MFLHCPPWRKPRPESPSEVARSYQESPTRVPQTLEQGQDIPHELEHPDSHAKLHTGSLSRIIRRRLSRDSRGSSACHDKGKIPFSFARKSPKPTPKHSTELAALAGYGSSLVSESRYDSDAQGVATPQQESAPSPSSPPSRVRLSDVIERSQEQPDSGQWGVEVGQKTTEPQQSICGMRFLQTPSPSLNSLQYSDLRESCPEGCRPLSHDPNHVDDPAKSATSTHMAEQPVSEFEGIPHPDASATLATAAEGWIMTAYQSQNCESEYGRGTSHEDSPTPSLLSTPTKLTVPKRRQRTDSGSGLGDHRSVHLGDMGISRQLASSPNSSVGDSHRPSSAEPTSLKRQQVRMSANIPSNPVPMSRSPTTHVNSDLGSEAPYLEIPTGLSSCPQDSAPLIGDMLETPPSPTSSVDEHVGTIQRSKYDPTAEDIREYENAMAAAKGSITSRFQEHCDSEASPEPKVLTQPCEPLAEAPRKVSIGWMSGGRRIGYGYAPVPSPDDDLVKHDNGTLNGSQSTLSLARDLVLPIPSLSTAVRDDQAGNDWNKECDPYFTAHSTVFKGSGLTGSLTQLEKIQPATLPRTKRPFKPDAETLQHNGSLEGPAKVGSRGLCTDCSPPALALGVGSDPHVKGVTKTQLDALRDHLASLRTSNNMTPRPAQTAASPETATVKLPQLKNSRSVSGSSYKDVDIDPDYPGIECQAVARRLRANSVRDSPISRRLSKFRVSKGYSSPSPKKASRSSLILDQARASGCLERGDSVRSSGVDAEALASMYQECINMPGSFEGSRWASRTSRLLLHRDINPDR
ncbi:hypothetical protein N7539_005018 [Penicillium diatomitis]|uniref:Uncharacterized protein n=1 Tax=Penicillium diatomitis TaxID=2819901 RepID=A0A9W9X635_9EURO|nr:uncharacterized protein N7539_005018 [Penicillium diatomitis]KAJ5485030.1 hypothetical protein N7539_005018 [Penicillium diatomitis]